LHLRHYLLGRFLSLTVMVSQVESPAMEGGGIAAYAPPALQAPAPGTSASASAPEGAAAARVGAAAGAGARAAAAGAGGRYGGTAETTLPAALTPSHASMFPLLAPCTSLLCSTASR